MSLWPPCLSGKGRKGRTTRTSQELPAFGNSFRNDMKALKACFCPGLKNFQETTLNYANCPKYAKLR